MGSNSPYNSPGHTTGSSSPYHVPGSSEYTNTTTSPQSPQELVIESDSLVQEVSYSPTVDNTQSAGGGKAPRRRRDPKPKLYQREEPLSDSKKSHFLWSFNRLLVAK